jgi:hypothetical protein
LMIKSARISNLNSTLIHKLSIVTKLLSLSSSKQANAADDYEVSADMYLFIAVTLVHPPESHRLHT